MHTTANAPISTSVAYPNPDLGFSQIQGSYDADKNGSVRNWTMTAGINNEHNHATGTGLYASVIGASVSKLKAGGGGLVFYIGNHDFNSSSATGINGIRMYMNAFLTPGSINNNCSIGQTVLNLLPIKLLFFNAIADNSNSKVDLKWITSTEINASHFVIERSTDGIHFSDQGMVSAFGNSTEQKNYFFNDNFSSAAGSTIYYRLRQVDNNGTFDYSPIRTIQIEQSAGKTALVYPNPVTNKLYISIPAGWQNKKVVLELFNSTGQLEKRSEVSGSFIEPVNMIHFTPGIYMVRMSCNNEMARQKIIKQ
ncbi:MAG: hypothetical protein JWM28_3884 [Chitinophagaceae bacterium]|nr:hypothetical protein [Chitinophagaceae bacterium]